ncbi:putative xylan 1,4-beta-xylosidase [Helianthus annuus]|nr:putative xylan 1,4-beta-xylosidase [Helianthus annuus]
MVQKPHIKCIIISPPSLFFILIGFLIVFTGKSRPPFACDPSNKVTKDLTFCRVNLPIKDRVKDLLGRLTLQEKISLLVNNAAAVPRLGIQGYEWWSEALHGVSDVGPGTKFLPTFLGATQFPQVITTASTFNDTLWEEIGQVVSNEARAMYNGGMAGLTFWSPNVNIFRDPRWGRGQETPGEDPALAARYAVRYVKGLQGNVGNRLKVAACCKHYTAYDLDSWHGYNRHSFNAKVSKQDLEDTYNVPFKACVLEGKVASVMCSYNQVNGKPTCADSNLLKSTIRGSWRLNGYIVSDCDSVGVMYTDQHYTATPEDATAESIKAGLDLDCGPSLAVYTEGAIKQGKLKEVDVDGALENTIGVQMRLGMFDGPKQPYANLGIHDVCLVSSNQLALEAARQGIVLLENRGRGPPLSTVRHRTVAVIGPNSDVTVTMIGNYAGIACGYTTPLQGIARYVKTVHQVGCSDVSCKGNQLIGLAEKAAQQADATLLPGHQQELISRVAKSSRGPCVLVIMSGGPLDITFAKRDPRILAIIWAGYPGQAGGTAIADVLFGTTNPGGKLPMTWYPQEYLAKVPMTNMGMRPDPAHNYPGRTYRFYKGPVVYPFGHGLSYTTFHHSIAQAPTSLSVPMLPIHLENNNATTLTNGVRISHTKCSTLLTTLHINVKNTGTMDGTHIMMVFSSPPEGKWATNKQLVGFQKVHVVAGGLQRVALDLHACKHLSVVDQFGIRRVPMGEHTLHIGDIKHSLTIKPTIEEIKY